MDSLFSIESAVYQGAPVSSQLAARRWDIAVTGDSGMQEVDARSKAAYEFAISSSETKFEIKFESNRTTLDGAEVRPGGIRSKLRGARSLLIEATSLNCPEILYLLRAVRAEGIKKVSFLYLEPKEYRRTLKGRLTDHRDYDLSHNRRFQSVHGFMANLTEIPKGQAVFFLGYEKSRLGQVLEQEETLQDWPKSAVFGVPAFESSWEIDSITNNVQHLCNSSYDVKYAAAASVEAAYRLLNGLLHDDKTESPVVVAPLGTKPHMIGASLFLIEHNEYDRAVLLYDHPIRVAGRSMDVKRWHLYDVYINS